LDPWLSSPVPSPLAMAALAADPTGVAALSGSVSAPSAASATSADTRPFLRALIARLARSASVAALRSSFSSGAANCRQGVKSNLGPVARMDYDMVVEQTRVQPLHHKPQLRW